MAPDSSGKASFSYTFPYSPQVLFTYTDANGNTSPESDHFWMLPTTTKDAFSVGLRAGYEQGRTSLVTPFVTYLQGKVRWEDPWIN